MSRVRIGVISDTHGLLRSQAKQYSRDASILSMPENQITLYPDGVGKHSSNDRSEGQYGCEPRART